MSAGTDDGGSPEAAAAVNGELGAYLRRPRGLFQPALRVLFCHSDIERNKLAEGPVLPREHDQLNHLAAGAWLLPPRRRHLCDPHEPHLPRVALQRGEPPGAAGAPGRDLELAERELCLE